MAASDIPGKVSMRSNIFFTLYNLQTTKVQSFSKVAFEGNLRKKLSRIEHVLIVKVSFERRKICESFHNTRAGFLSKITFESDFRKKTF